MLPSSPCLLYVTCVPKLWNDDHRPRHVAEACRASLERLQLDYLDLYLVHWPAAWRKGTLGCPDDGVSMEETWRAMETLVDQGLVRAIGVSNFGPERLSRLLSTARIAPVCNQIELHPSLQQQGLVDLCQSKGVAVTAWSPLAKGKSATSQAGDTVSALAKQRGISPSSLVLLWHLSRGVIAIPRSSNPAHIQENCDVWRRATAAGAGGLGPGVGPLALLSSEELALMRGLDRGARLTFDFVGVFEETKWPWPWVGTLLCAVARVIWAVLPNWLDFRMPK